MVRLAPGFGGINLEDIRAPRCFEVERKLQERLDIPVFHDDQHGTAIVVLAALRSAAAVTGRTLGDLRVVVSGAGAAGVAVTRILLEAGIGDIAVADSRGVLHPGRAGLTDVKRRLADDTNRAGLTGRWSTPCPVPTSSSGCPRAGCPRRRSPAWRPRQSSSPSPTPTPRWRPTWQRGTPASTPAGAATCPTRSTTCWRSRACSAGHSVRATRVTEGMKLAAAAALADLVADDLRPEQVLPPPFDERVAPAVAAAVAAAARRDGVARLPDH